METHRFDFPRGENPVLIYINEYFAVSTQSMSFNFYT